jgi:hypothetical protein
MARALLSIVGLLIGLPASAFAQAPGSVEPRAAEALRQMSSFLAETPRLSVEAEESFDSPDAKGLRAELNNVRRITVERPGRLAVTSRGDTLTRSSWYDGRSLTILNTKLNVYVTMDAPPTIDGVFDKVAEELGVSVPLSDFFYSDPYASLMEGVVAGRHLGVHEAAGVPCQHLTFSQEGLSWQVWIESGERPLPRRLVMTYEDVPGTPRYAATLRRWDLNPKIDPAMFKFTPPPGAKPLDLAALR